ncbi:polynucleotide adenylyltransferase PcnB [Candidatus Moduliflexota bacterium]
MNIIRKFLGFISGGESGRSDEERDPIVVSRENHIISRKSIDADALKVLNRLNRFKHTAYLVGGGVRDLLLEGPVKDFDIATSAHPHEVKKLFRNSRLIGRRFRLVHILFRERKVIEVSTFRSHAGFSDEADLLIKSDNTFGSSEEDARRRDFTVNGLFYNIADFSIIDYVGGLKDLESKVIATIGDPDIRFREDPIRMLRAIRFAARLDFDLAPSTRQTLERHRKEIWKGAVPRILDELLKMLRQGSALKSFRLMNDLKILEILLPRFARDYGKAELREQIERSLEAIDGLTKPKADPSPALLGAVLYSPSFHALMSSDNAPTDRLKAAAELLAEDLAKLNFPKMQSERARQILAAQHRIENIGKRKIRPSHLVRKGYFDDALTLFELSRPPSKENRSIIRRWQALKKSTGQPEGDEKSTREDRPTGRRPGSRRRRRSSRGTGRRPDSAQAGEAS